MTQVHKASQKERVLKLLRDGKTLTQAQARATYKISKLSARVSELRRDNVPITSTPFRHRNGRVVVRYEMVA